MFPDVVSQFLRLPCLCLRVHSWLAFRYKVKSTVPVPMSLSRGVRHHGCKITQRMKFLREVYLYSWLDAPVVSMGMGRAAQ